jgi:hypothetical protein
LKVKGNNNAHAEALVLESPQLSHNAPERLKRSRVRRNCFIRNAGSAKETAPARGCRWAHLTI